MFVFFLIKRCYDACEEPSYLVFEDLAASGYANLDRRTGLDVEHFKHLVTKAAKWHAATAVLLNEVYACLRFVQMRIIIFIYFISKV